LIAEVALLAVATIGLIGIGIALMVHGRRVNRRPDGPDVRIEFEHNRRAIRAASDPNGASASPARFQYVLAICVVNYGETRERLSDLTIETADGASRLQRHLESQPAIEPGGMFRAEISARRLPPSPDGYVVTAELTSGLEIESDVERLRSMPGTDDRPRGRPAAVQETARAASPAGASSPAGGSSPGEAASPADDSSPSPPGPVAADRPPTPVETPTAVETPSPAETPSGAETPSAAGPPTPAGPAGRAEPPQSPGSDPED
jgi:hypothetical protein